MTFAQLRIELARMTPAALTKVLLEIIKENDLKLIELNQEQLFEGVDSKNNFLRPPYASDAYANYKLRKNPLGVVDLKLTGAFYNDFFVSANEFPIFLGSTDEKTFMLVDKYGSNIFGLTEESIERIRKEVILPQFTAFIRSSLKL